jgi:hypothetical protein
MTFIIHGDAPSMLLGDGGGGDAAAVMCSMSSICSICVDNHIVDDDDYNIDSDDDLEYIISVHDSFMKLLTSSGDC